MKQINLSSIDDVVAGHARTSIVYLNNKEYILSSKDSDERASEFVGDLISNNKRLNAKVSKSEKIVKEQINKAHKYKCNHDRIIELKSSFINRLLFLFRAL